jgi:hypothetical protein
MAEHADGGKSEELVDASDMETGIRLARNSRHMEPYPRLTRHIGNRADELVSFLTDIGVPEYHRAHAWALVVHVASEAALAMRTAIVSDIFPLEDFPPPPPESDCDVPF